MRKSTMTTQSIRSGITVVLAVFMLLTPFSTLAQDATPTVAEDVAVSAAPAPGSMQITLTDTAGFALSGSFAAVDANGTYQDVWVTDGFGQAASLAAGTATVTQLTGTTDYAVDATPRYIDIPEGGIGYATITNTFLDADADGVGDSVDACPAGNDAIDTDADGTADACDATPNGDLTPSPTAESTAAPTSVPTVTPASTPSEGQTNRVSIMAPAAASATSCEMLGSESAAVGEYVMFRCSAPRNPVKIDVSNITPGWKWAHIFSDSEDLTAPSFDSLTWSTAGGSSSASGSNRHAYVFMTPTTDVRAGALGVMNINVTHPNGTYHYSAQPTARKAISAEDFSLVCSPSEIALSGMTPGTVECTLSAVTVEWGIPVTVTVPAPVSPAGWNISPKSALTGTVYQNTPMSLTFEVALSGTGLGATAIIPVTSNLMIAGRQVTGPVSSFTSKAALSPTSVTDIIATTSVWGGTTDLSAKVSPAGASGSVAFYVNGSTTPAQGNVTYTTSTGIATLTGYAHGLPASTTPYAVRAVFTPSGSTHTGSEAMNESALFVEHVPLALTDVASEMSWSRPYSHFDATDTGWLQYTVRGTATKGWTVQVTASEFSQSGGGPSIPASSLTFSTESTTPGTELTTPATSGSLGTGPIVLSGTSQTPPGPYTQRLNLTMTIPGGTLVGQYTSNITITAAAAP